MPRSSGGGSHHSGGHSHHSGGGSHRSGGGSGSSMRNSSTYFKGSTRYVYYNHHKPVYFYANYDPTRKPSPLRFLMILFYLPFLFGICMIFITSVRHPTKLNADYDTKIVIRDEAGVLEDERALLASLSAFYDKTGITPAVMTIYNEEWQNFYDSLEDCAYDLYVNQFRDEKHWLIVYSQPQKITGKYVDWYWEGMQGDDTIRILNDAMCDKFNAEMQKNLTASNFYTVDKAIGAAFDKLTPVVMKLSIQWEAIGMGLFMALFVGVHMYFMMDLSPKKAKQRKAVACPEGTKEDTCDYCGGIYLVGTCTTCPHCNAPLRMHNPYEPEPTADYNTGGTINLNGEQYRP